MQQFDLVVIGGGPGGYVAAIRAGQLGMKVALVEREHLGGVCLNWGCIPTKALLRSAEIKHLMDHSDDFGFEVSGVKPNLEKIVARSRQISSQLAAGIQALLKKNKVIVFDGHASFESEKTIIVCAKDDTVQKIGADHIIIATGARARTLSGAPQDPRIWSAREAMTPKDLPKRLLIIGSGAIGMEFASFYQTMGSQVHVVEMQDRILFNEDVEISTLALKAFKKQGMEFSLSSTTQNIKATPNHISVEIMSADKKVIVCEVDAVIVAIGIIGNTENLALEKTKVRVEKGQIETNEWAQTASLSIYAIGDVAGAPWLAHKASHEAIMCVEKIKGIPGVHPLQKDHIPGCTYSLPQIASIGYTEQKAKDAGYTLKVGRFSFRGNGKALALGEREGLVKTIFDAKTGELLGAHMIGAEVTELVQGFVLARRLEATEAELMHTIFPHPTLSEMMHESVLDAYGRVIHS